VGADRRGLGRSFEVAAQPPVDNAEPGQRVAFAVVIAELAAQVQALQVTVSRLLVAALPLRGQAEAAQRACLAVTVAVGTEEGDGLLLMVGGL
jgi:hypothetical protein